MKLASCRMSVTALDIVKNAHQQHASDISLTASLYMTSQDSNKLRISQSPGATFHRHPDYEMAEWSKSYIT